MKSTSWLFINICILTFVNLTGCSLNKNISLLGSNSQIDSGSTFTIEIANTTLTEGASVTATLHIDPEFWVYSE